MTVNPKVISDHFAIKCPACPAILGVTAEPGQSIHGARVFCPHCETSLRLSCHDEWPILRMTIEAAG